MLDPEAGAVVNARGAEGLIAHLSESVSMTFDTTAPKLSTMGCAPQAQVLLMLVCSVRERKLSSIDTRHLCQLVDDMRRHQQALAPLCQNLMQLLASQLSLQWPLTPANKALAGALLGVLQCNT